MFHYKVKFLDTLGMIEEEEEGLTDSSDYVAAAKRLSAYYGNDEIISLELTALEDVLTDEDIKNEFVRINYGTYTRKN